MKLVCKILIKLLWQHSLHTIKCTGLNHPVYIFIIMYVHLTIAPENAFVSMIT